MGVSLQLKFGNVTAANFPKGSFPPSLPFTRTGEESDPLADAGGRDFLTLLSESPRTIGDLLVNPSGKIRRHVAERSGVHWRF